MNRITKSLLVVAATLVVTGLSITATRALLSDTESSTGNTLAAGAIDLKIDNDSYYNGAFNQGTSWLKKSDLDDGQGPASGSYYFFDFHDLKPGDYGEDTISIEVDDNDAWGCMDLTLTQNDDVSSTEPELKETGEILDVPTDSWDGELAQNMKLIIWVDDGDNVLEEGERPFFNDSLSALIALPDKKLPIVLADSTGNKFETTGPLLGKKVYYIAKAWCFGNMTLAPVASNTGDPATNPGYTCDGSTSGNITQTDKVMGDFSFNAVQARNNQGFTCYGPPTPKADLSLTKTADPVNVIVGQNTTYTIQVNNSGPANATGVTVSDLLPAGVTWISDDGGLAYDHLTGIWTIGAIPVSGTVTLHITVQVNHDGTIINIAEVATSDQIDPDSTPGNHIVGEDDQASASVGATLSADLSLDKTLNPASVGIGAIATVTLTVSNAGPNPATGVTVKDILPVGLTYVSDDSGGAYVPGTGIWTVGTLSNGNSATIHIIVTVTQQGDILNTAEVWTAIEPDPDSTPGDGNINHDDWDSATVHGLLSDLELDKTVNVDTAPKGSLVFFTVTITNKGPDTAVNTQVDDTFPAGLPYLSHSATHGTFNSGTGIWSIPSIPANGIARLDVTVNTSGDPGIFTNIAEVLAAGQPDPDSTPGNASTTEDDDDSASVTITPL